MRYTTLVICIYGLVNWYEKIRKIYKYEIFIILYPFITLISSFIWIGSEFVFEDLSRIQFLLPVMKIPIIYFGTKSLLCNLRENKTAISNLLRISAFIIFMSSLYKLLINFSALTDFDPTDTNSEILFETNYYFDILSIVFAASIFKLSSLRSNIGRNNIYFYLIGFGALITGLISSFLFSTRFTSFSMLLSIFLILIFFGKEILFNIQKSLKVFFKNYRLKFYQIFIFFILIIFCILAFNKISSFLEGNTFAKSIFLNKFAFEDFSLLGKGYGEGAIDHRIELYTNFLKIDLIQQISMLFIGLGAGSFNNIFKMNPHGLINEILFNAGIPVVISYMYFIFGNIKKITLQTHTLKYTLFFYITFLFFSILTHDFGRSSSIWVFFAMYANISEILPMNRNIFFSKNY